MEQPNFLDLTLSLLGGLAIFLYGMKKMTDALKGITGSGMKRILRLLTGNRVSGLLAGAGITAIIQSSSLTTVLVVGFISAGLMNLTQSVGVIIGAGIGTTITAQIIAFKVTALALPLIATGFAIDFISIREKSKKYGSLVFGLGLIFLGLQIMSHATSPLRDYQPFISLMKSMENPLAAILVSTIFTALIQSSSAAIGIYVILAAQGFLNLETGIALIFGSNIGTCITALLAAIGKPVEAVQAGLVHLIVKVGGVLLWIFLIPTFAGWVKGFSPSSDLTGTALLAAEVPRQLANAHTLFNLVNAGFFIWFVGPLVKLVTWITPAPQIEAIKLPKFSKVLLQQPELSLVSVERELAKMENLVSRMVKENRLHSDNFDGNQQAPIKDEIIDLYHREIISFLGKLSEQELSGKQRKKLFNYMAVANYLENIGDVISQGVFPISEKLFSNQYEVSEETSKHFDKLFSHILARGQHLHSVLSHLGNGEKKPVLVDSIGLKKFLADHHEARKYIMKRLGQKEDKGDGTKVSLFRIEIDYLEHLRRVFTLYRRASRKLKPFLRNG